MNLDDPPPHGFYVSSDWQILDHVWTHAAIVDSYWGKHRTPEQIAVSLANSLCFGLFEHVATEGGETKRDRQIGFARVITDSATFSELVDVIIDPAFRGRGLGKFLVGTVIRDPRISRTVINLGTRDAHSFYEKLGFKRVEKMKLIPS